MHDEDAGRGRATIVGVVLAVCVAVAAGCVLCVIGVRRRKWRLRGRASFYTEEEAEAHNTN